MDEGKQTNQQQQQQRDFNAQSSSDSHDDSVEPHCEESSAEVNFISSTTTPLEAQERAMVETEITVDILRNRETVETSVANPESESDEHSLVAIAQHFFPILDARALGQSSPPHLPDGLVIHGFLRTQVIVQSRRVSSPTWDASAPPPVNPHDVPVDQLVTLIPREQIERFARVTHSGSGELLDNHNNEKKEGKEKCPICLEVFVKMERVVELDCHHKFHRQCTYQMFTISTTCPVCRREYLHRSQLHQPQ